MPAGEGKPPGEPPRAPPGRVPALGSGGGSGGLPPPPPLRGKGRAVASRADKQKRLWEVEQMIASGFDTPALVRAITSKWNLTRRSAELYIAQARAELRRMGRDERDQQDSRERLLLMANASYRGAMAEGDYRACASLLDVLMRLEGVGGMADGLGQLVKRLLGESGVDKDQIVAGMMKLRTLLYQQASRGNPRALQEAVEVTDALVRELGESERPGKASGDEVGSAGSTAVVILPDLDLTHRLDELRKMNPEAPPPMVRGSEDDD